MEVIRAEAIGLCFGVRDALDVAFARDDAAEVTIYGELVHNERVLDRLRERGFRMVGEAERGTSETTGRLLVTAHGLSNRAREGLLASGKELIDTTCPLVQKVHNAALRLQDAGYFPVVIGRHGHVEVRGVVEDLGAHAVVASEAEVADLRSDALRIGVVCQTTFPEAQVLSIVAALKRRFAAAEVRFVNTTCDPTRQRLAAVQRLLPRVDAMVVVGGSGSNNTRQLLLACGDKRAVQVQSAADLDPGFFAGLSVIGLAAGTSTLDEDVDAVEAALCAMAPSRQVG